MITVKVSRKAQRIKTVEIKGHAEYGASGEDIVCAGVSAVSQTALLGILKVAKAEVEYTAENGYLRFSVKEKDTVKLSACDTILETMFEGLKDLQSGYPEFIEISGQK